MHDGAVLLDAPFGEKPEEPRIHAGERLDPGAVQPEDVVGAGVRGSEEFVADVLDAGAGGMLEAVEALAALPVGQVTAVALPEPVKAMRPATAV